MNARLKAKAAASGMSLKALEKMCALIRDDDYVEKFLDSATAKEIYAEGIGVRYASSNDAPMMIRFKDLPPDAPDDDSELTLSQGDLDAIAAVVSKALRQGAPAQAKPKLSDQGAMVLPSTKAYSASSDLFAIAVGADQVGRPPVATKSRPVTLEALVKGYRWDGR